MDNELTNKIIDDLLKSGFGAEMLVLQTLRKKLWTASGIANYQDLDSNITRESDIVAHNVLAESEDDEDMDILYQVFYGLSIEVKKSNKPWIVMKEKPTYSMELLEGSSSMIFCDGVNRKFAKGIFSTLGSTSLSKKLGWFGNGVHESFKNPDQPSRWYSSFISVCKAAEHNFIENSWQISEKEESDHFPYLWYQKPIVVLDGELFSAELNQKNDIDIIPIDYCSVKFQFSTENYKRGKYIVDLVKLSSFAQYLDFCSSRLISLKDGLLKLAEL